MIMFWLVAAGMVLLAMSVVGLPLLGRRSIAEVSRNEINTGIFHERLAELETDYQEGRVDTTQYRQLQVELERRLLADVPEATERYSHAGALAVKLAGIAALAVPLLALGYYYLSAYRGEVKTWMALQQQLQGTVTKTVNRPDELPAEAREDLAGFTRVLQSRLSRGGMKDPDGLLLLGNSYLQMRRLPEALTALGRAYELAPQRPDILLASAQAMILTQDERLSGTGMQLLHAVLQLNPNHQGALMLLGLGAFNSGDYEQALHVWRQLLALQDPDSQGAELLRNGINRAEQRLASRGENKAPSVESSPVTSSQVMVTVDLAPALREKLSPQDTLYIFAKATDGSPMPLAAVQQPVQSFPVQVMLDDERAVMPAMKLSDFQQIVVIARISKAGNVTAQPGDLQGAPATVNLHKGLQSVSLLIDQVVQ